MYKLQNKSILLISPEPWSHIFVSKHHYAIHLAKKGNKVYFLNPPSNTFRVEKTIFKDVYSVHYKGFIKGLRFFPALIQKWLVRQKFDRLERLCDSTFEVVWAFDNSVFYDFSSLPGTILKISHIVDLNQDFETQKAASTADICFGTTRFIIQRLTRYNKNAHFINHGYNNHYVDLSIKNNMPGENKIKAVMVGNLSMPYLDWEVLTICAQNHPKIDFVFYGPNASEYSLVINHHHRFKKKLYDLPNAFFPGKIGANEIPAVLNAADVLLISYREEHHSDQANPHKMMEYLGVGKVVVATKTLEYETLTEDSLIAMSDRNEDYPEFFDRVVSDMEKWNSRELRDKRRAYAINNTYATQIKRIEKRIGSKPRL